MTTIIAIVGRPNVGKSTLFNRLTRSRNALVADQPGVTRDRQYGFAEYEGQTFILIDTGGLCDSTEQNQSISNMISKQSLTAVKEADVVLWLVDGSAELTATDETIAQQLRPKCSHLYLLVNKTEGQDVHTVCAEFHSLGVGTPIPISAQRGDGVSFLMNTLCIEFPDNNTTAIGSLSGLKVSIIGRPNVGKSTLINRMLGEERMLTYEQPGTTRDSVAVPFQRRCKEYILIDTAGVRRRSRVINKLEKFSVIKTLQAIDQAQVIIMVIDAQEALTEQDLTLLGLTTDSGKSLIIAINKWDGLEPAQRSMIKNQVDRKLDFVSYAYVHYISALHGTGVGKLFNTIDKVGASQAITIKSSVVTEILSSAVEEHPPPLIRGRRIKLRYAHVGGHNPLRIIIHGNQTKHVPESYRRYLSNKIRQRLKLIGTPVVIEFKRSENPYKGNKNVLNKSQLNKRKRLMKHVKK